MTKDDFWADFLGEEVRQPSCDDLLASLNPAQRAAVQHREGPLLILAGPGSGKTRVITHRIAYMIADGVPSHQIVALTFTNKAADEMRSRLGVLAPEHMAWTGTFHRFCSRLLRQHAPLVGLAENFTIYDMGDSHKMVKQAIESARVDLDHYSPEMLIQHLGSIKNAGVLVDEYRPRPGMPMDAILARVYPEYQRLLKDANAVDFDDLLLYAVELLRDNPELREAYDERYAWFMVDEYQDTNSAQYKLIRMLNHNVRNLAVTGDPDQSIYGWRGANLNNILNFERDYPGVEVVRLEENYRSTKAILRVADQLIENNVRRKQKRLKTDNPEGAAVRLVAYPGPQEEARDLAETIEIALREGTRTPNDFAIFYRANWLSRALEFALRNAGIPYQVINGHEFYQRREIKDLIAYLLLLNNPRDTIAFERVINVPPRKIGKVTLGRLRQYAADHRISLLEAARAVDQIETITRAPSAKIHGFVAMYDRLIEISHGNVESILKAVLAETGYREWLVEDGSEQGQERAGNVDELLVAAREFDQAYPDDASLDQYLEQAALVSDTDSYDRQSESVKLMTLHASKGLEFPFVFLVGLEDGILPHERSAADDGGIEEERRLLFVGITRAREELQLSRCLARFRRGSFWPAIASRFLMEMPREEMQTFEPGGYGGRYSREDDFYEEHPEEPFEREYLPEGEGAISFDVAEIEEGLATSRPPEERSPDSRFPQLVTAAELAARQEGDPIRTHPSAYAVGQEVEHDEYGLGTIESLSGKALKRTATVDFPGLGRKRFRLAFSQLRIVR